VLPSDLLPVGVLPGESAAQLSFSLVIVLPVRGLPGERAAWLVGCIVRVQPSEGAALGECCPMRALPSKSAAHLVFSPLECCLVKVLPRECAALSECCPVLFLPSIRCKHLKNVIFLISFHKNGTPHLFPEACSTILFTLVIYTMLE
jgi:hypothetical protein